MCDRMNEQNNQPFLADALRVNNVFGLGDRALVIMCKIQIHAYLAQFGQIDQTVDWLVH